MDCENCHERTATVHLTEIVNNSKRELHLCEDCAKEKGVTIKTPFKEVDVSFPQFFGEMLKDPSEEVSGEKAVRCDVCGMTYKKFRSGGKFGCPQCYDIFKEGLMPLLDKVHGATQHRGKVPTRAGHAVSRQKELRQLREELHRSIEREAYELAAQIRDRIYHLEGRSSGSD